MPDSPTTSTWSTKPLSAFVDYVTYGFTSPMPTVESGPFMITAKDVNDGRINYETARRTSHEAYRALTAKSRPRIGDVLLTKDGSIGRIAVCDRDDICINQSVAAMRPNGEISPQYLSYLLQAPRYQRAMEADSDGSTIKHIYITRVDKMPITVPSKQEQEGIVAVLSAIDKKISSNAELSQTSENLIAASFTQLGIDRSPTDRDSTTLTEYFDINPKYDPPSKAEPVYLDMKRLPTQTMLVRDWGFRAPRGGVKFQNFDTLIARITPCLENGKTGYVDFLDENETAIGSTEYIVLRSRDGVPMPLSYFMAISPKFREFAIRNMIGTSGRQRLRASDIELYEVSRISHQNLQAWNELASPVIERIRKARDESQNLERLRDLLLPHLISGAIRLPDAEALVRDAL